MLEFVEIIQMAVAPAFLLTALGAILTVMANRLSRIVDRHRVLREQKKSKDNKITIELASLKHRAKCTHWAIAFTTIAALLISLLIAMIFITVEVYIDLDRYLAILFIIAMTFLIIGLLCFLREVHLSKGVINDYEM
ncbi:DUF2721 domain-containing protein [Methylophilaceae bacterium]|nr:DUF2721 domain-containing protein [Methylophilaceae bacterium]|tara:strand:- start:763 stop:1173 length:411 start_codon:yes stop_codon:yes gene_type:complete